MVLFTLKYLPRFIFALTVKGQVKDWANSNYLPFKTTLFGQIQDEVKLFESVEGRK